MGVDARTLFFPTYPTAIRASFQVYEFTNVSEWWERGHWWKSRPIVGDIPRVYATDDGDDDDDDDTAAAPPTTTAVAAATAPPPCQRRRTTTAAAKKPVSATRQNVEKRQWLLLLLTLGLFLALHFAVRTLRRGVGHTWETRGPWAALLSVHTLHLCLLAASSMALCLQFALVLVADYPALQTAVVLRILNLGGGLCFVLFCFALTLTF